MKCPLFIMAVLVSPGLQGTVASDCTKEECGAYDDARGCCAIITIADALEGIMLNLNRIEDKMPSPEFFKK